MRKAVFAAVLLATASLGLAACGSSAPSSSSTSAPAAAPATSSASPSMMSHSAAPDLKGSFEGLNGKKVSGSVTVGMGAVQLSGFSSDMGPDLHVYLAKGTDEAAVAAGKEISAVKYDVATQSFMLKDTMASDYGYVIIHCDKAKAVFGAAKLQ